MASLINRLDFWDKEENKRQREEEARRAAQAASQPRQRNIASRAFDQVNPFDNNRTFKQAAPTQSKSTFQQVGQLGGQTVRGMFNPIAKTANTGLAALNVGNELRKTAQASVFGSDRDYSNAVQNMARNNNRFIKPGSGVLGTGSWFKDTNEATNIGTKDLAGRIVGAGAETYLAGKGLKMGGFTGKALLDQGLKNGVRTQLPNLGKNAVVNTLEGVARGRNEGQGWKDSAKTGALSGVLGTAGDVGLGVLGAGLRKGLTPAVKTVYDNAPKLNSSRNKPFVINEGVPTVQPQKPLQIKAGVPLANNPLAPRRGLQIVDNNPQPFKIVDNSVPKKVSGAAQQSMLSKAKNAWNNRTPMGEAGSTTPESPLMFGVGKLFKDKEIPQAPRRSQSPLRAGMSEDEFFQRFNPDVRSEAPSLSRASDAPDVPSVSPKRLPQETQPQAQPQTPPLRSGKTDIEVPSVNRTPRQLEIKESTAPFSNEQQKLVKDYADMLRYMGEGNGVSVNKSTGKRVSNNVRTAETQGQGRVDWQAEAERQLRNGKAEPEIQKAFQELDDPEFRSLAQSADASTAKGSVGDKFETDPLEGFRQKIQQRSGESNIPVRKMVTDGDTVTATNVNPNIKAKEKRFALDEDGNLIEDKTGAYSIFSDGEGKVKQVRIGNEVFTAKDFGDLSDVNDYGSTLATMRRNVERGFGKKTSEKLSKFLVDHQQGQATRMIERNLAMKEGLKGIADELDINFAKNTKKAKQVSAAIQNFGEGAIGKQQLIDDFGAEYAEKIVKADTWFKSQYDTLLNEMNSTLTKYGYDPVPKRNNYYTHFQDESMWQKFGLKMQEIRSLAGPTMQDAAPEGTRGKISNALAGQSEFMTPNKRFNPFALQRKGNTYTSDAFQAFERYLDPTLNNIYMTPSITRARVVAKAIAQDADIVGKDANKIIIQTREWANNLAGKSNRFDRPIIDTKAGQTYLKAAQWAQKKAGQNTIVGNLSTAVMQPIVIAQTTGKFGLKNTILGAMQEMGSAHAKDAPIRQSQFMRRRYADLSRVTDGKMDKARSVANKPLEVVEETSARITWNAAHNDALSKGLKGKEAIQYADVQAEKTLAGRSIGEKPELLRSKAAGPLTMYQLEVNNYWQQFAKEMTKAQAAKTMVAAFGLNLLLQEATGRQVGFNPIDAAIDSYKEIGKEEKSTGDKVKDVGRRVAGEVVDNVPFASAGLNLAFGDKGTKWLGPTSNAGRFGASSPISALVTNPASLVSPFGAGQAKKTYEGAKTLIEGGLNNKDGERTVDVPRTPENITKGLLFGKGAIPEVNAYYNNIGRKKPDQSVVPNQISSVAGGQGLGGLTKDQQEMLRDLPQDRKAEYVKSLQAENKIGRQVDREKDSIKKEKTAKKLSDGRYYGKVGDSYKTYDSEQLYKIAKAKNDFKNSKDSERTIEGVKYRKTSSGTIVKATTPKPTTPKKSTKKTSSRKSSGGRGRQPSLDLLLKAISPVKVPAIKTAKLKSSAPKLPSMKTVKTPRVATRPRNRGNVTSTKVKIS